MCRGWLWLLLPLAALLETGGYFFFSRSAPEPENYLAVVEPVRRLAAPADAIVVVPRWAEPHVRMALGDELWTIEDAARASFDNKPRALEISLPGHTDPNLGGWPLLQEERHAGLQLRLRQNPNYTRPRFRVVEAVSEGRAEVFRLHEGTRHDCPWTQRARTATGGLHGHVAFPKNRYMCGARGVEFVGVTIIDDQQYQPRRCVWAHPVREGELWLSFDDVTLGATLRGHAGLSWFLMRDGAGTEVLLEVFVDGRKVGQHVHRDEQGWAPFQFATEKHAGTRGRLDFRVTSQRFERRHFCFAAETL